MFLSSSVISRYRFGPGAAAGGGGGGGGSTPAGPNTITTFIIGRKGHRHPVLINNIPGRMKMAALAVARAIYLC